ncbi:WecB/TagA/CpsF family glycosyltransferase [Ulvibacter litoralis]|uniref:N-acetylglucosaminyldiphosphoundecaprenol N-acetyl-beta-D-mannosaminyltransferase n=1 Tax=Ulvibacter litoralis TaxID=227084 RepID=A0A1G7D7Y7_9FLAO|nr:WecB/TagA/CpsF family glycosyltransferase [Ulvibacter litoralis]SDE47754.1 N-acetylglucosaminyldiphosphoundecaprenol N-acetyl-beta-D-mannosaminyltransferase [Ulvibacter litoralis]
MQDTLVLVEQAITEKRQLHHAAVNASVLVSLQKDNELRESINNADIVNVDGQAVVWASNFLGVPLKERVAGPDLMTNLVELAHKKNYKIYLLGAKEEVVLKLVDIYKKKYRSSIIAGYRNGYFNEEDECDIINDIVNSDAQMLFVAITSPKKENFLHKHKKSLSKVNFIMGVGGSFDVFAGKIKRAPQWMQNSGLEWFYRFLQEPKRMWKRYLVGNTKFILLVLKEKFYKK